MRSSSGRRLAVVLMAAAMLAGTACSSDDKSSDSSTTSATSAGPTSSTAASGADDVAKLQEDLNAVGCRAGAVDGEMGPHTEEALAAFQKAEGLSASGEIDGATETALAEATKAGKAVCETPVTSTSTASSPTSAGGATPACDKATFQALLASGDTVNEVNCAEGYAVVFYSTPDFDATGRYEAEGGTWVENDDCDEFPASLKADCETN